MTRVSNEVRDLEEVICRPCPWATSFGVEEAVGLGGVGSKEAVTEGGDVSEIGNLTHDISSEG
jgi:hypothetical protein